METVARGVATRPDIDREIGETIGLGRGGRRRRWLKRAAWLAVGLAAITFLALRLRPRAPAGPSFDTRAAARRELRVAVTASGTLEPSTTVEVGPEISGRVRAVRVDYNDLVTRGQVLIELDTDQLAAQLAQADSQVGLGKAGLEQARATDAEARLTLSRTATLSARGTVSDAELDAAKATARRARAALAAAEAQLRAAEAARTVARTSLAKATIRSPIDGIVLSRTVDAGQTVVAMLQAPVLLRLAEDLGRMRLIVDVDEADVSHVAAGSAATFTVAAYPDRVFEARVSSVRNAAAVRDNVVTYQAVLEVDNRARLLRPGMTATAQIAAEIEREALVVPNAALRFRPTGKGMDDAVDSAHRVWVLRDGKPAPVVVKLGPTDGADTVVRGGELAPGDAVVVAELER